MAIIKRTQEAIIAAAAIAAAVSLFSPDDVSAEISTEPAWVRYYADDVNEMAVQLAPGARGSGYYHTRLTLKGRDPANHTAILRYSRLDCETRSTEDYYLQFVRADGRLGKISYAPSSSDALADSFEGGPIPEPFHLLCK